MTVTQVAEVYRVPVEAMPGISEGLKPFGFFNSQSLPAVTVDARDGAHADLSRQASTDAIATRPEY
jgi:hypothetical protein